MDAFTYIVNGIIGVSKDVLQMPHRKILVLLFPGIAITAAAVLMARPRLESDQSSDSEWRILIGAVAGAVVGGSGIGIVFGIVSAFTEVLGIDSVSFCGVAGLVGGVWFGAAVWLRLTTVEKWNRRLVLAGHWGARYAVVGVLLWLPALLWRDTVAGIQLGLLGTAYLHGAFFTASFVIGLRIGGRSAGVLAATLEGVGGFVVGNSVALGVSNILWLLLSAGAVLLMVSVMWVLICLPRLSFETTVKRLGAGLPPITFATVLAILVLFSPLPDTGAAPIAARAIHYLGIILLFAFLLFGMYCQFESCLIIRRHAPLAVLSKIYSRWWAATKILPAPAAICIMIGGMGLVYGSPSNGYLNNGWLFWLVFSFSVFFWDGLAGYLPEICYRRMAVQKACAEQVSTDDFAPKYLSRRSEAMLLAHAVSFPIVFALGACKPERLWIPRLLVQWLYKGFESFDPWLARIGGVVLLIASIGLVVVLARLPGLVRRVKFIRTCR